MEMEGAMRGSKALLALMVMAYAQPAAADWQWTRWGMTRGEALSASQGKAAFATAQEKQRRMYRRGFTPIQVPELVIDAQAGGSEFQAYLLFDTTSAKLTCVDLIPKPGVAVSQTLRQGLVQTYGTPVQEVRKELPGVEWTTTTWVAEHDTIELQQGGLGTKLKYCERNRETVALR